MSLAEPSPLGTKISLLSNSQIRYEGFLCGLDQTANTVSLRNVRIFGTEGRRGGDAEVLPSPQIFELIVFRGGDIHDLTVYESNQASAGGDPAILSVTSGGGVGAPLAAVAVGGGIAPQKAVTSAPLDPQPQNNRGFYDETPARNARNNYKGPSNNYSYRYQGGGGGSGGRGNYQRRAYGRGRGGPHYRGPNHSDSHTGMDFLPAAENKKEAFKEDFDFEKARQDFEKNKKALEEAREEAKHHNKVYDKSSFFDNISGDQKDRGASRMDREEMKKADTETFGSEMVGRMNPNGYLRGRGGRGRYQRY